MTTDVEGRVIRGARAIAAAGAVAILTTLGIGTGTSTAQAPAEFYGVVTQGRLGPSNFERMRRGNVGTVRLKIDWAAIDRSPAPDDFDWPVFDPLVVDAARSGIQVLPFLHGTPTWVAKRLDKRHCPEPRCFLYAPRSKGALRAWQQFVAGAVDRYGPNGTLWAENPGVPRMPLDEWQIWNEQNSEIFYAPKPRPKRYARLLIAASRAIRDHDPSARVLLGGMAELAGSRQAVDASGFLADLYKIKGAKKSFDGVATHPYGSTMAKVRSQMKSLRRVMKRAGDGGSPMYVTEIGASSAEGENMLDLGIQGQASFLNAVYAYCERKRLLFNIQTVDWFSWRDNSQPICLWCSSSGLLTEGGDPKPSYEAFTSFSGGTTSKR